LETGVSDDVIGSHRL